MEADRFSRSKRLVFASHSGYLHRPKQVPNNLDSVHARLYRGFPQGKLCYRICAVSQEHKMKEHDRIRILVVDDHPLLHEGLASIIQCQPDMIVIGVANRGCDAVRQFRECKPDVTLMDLQLPDMSGIDAMISIRSEFPEARVIILTT